jgi:hypothetical protein
MSFKGEHPHYLGLYKRYLAPREANIRKVLELGVAQGESLLAWLQWFPEAQVIGVDNRYVPKEQLIDRCRIIQADQADPELLDLGKFDLIVDDAGHDPIKQRASLGLLWTSLNKGGLYVIEDLETSYWKLASWNLVKLSGCTLEGWDNPDGIIAALHSLTNELTASYAKERPERFLHLGGLESIHFHPNIVFLEKG